ncbi:hypothetical protein H5410_003329, partial [Solanum commersonii]
FKWVFIVFKNLCYEGSLGAVSRDHRHTRRSVLWSSSSPFCFCHQHLYILNHWAVWCCFADLFGDAPTASFHRQLDLFLQGSVHWNIRQDLVHSFSSSKGCLKQCYTRLNHECTHKTQLTNARIHYVLKDSSCDTPLSKILKLTILASNASSSSTKVFKFSHTKNDSIFTHNGLII